MTSYSKRQLRSPRPARGVYVVTAGASAEGGEAGGRQAFSAAAAAIDLPSETLARFVNSCCYVPPGGAGSGALHQLLGLAPLGSVDAVKGGPALWTAASAVAGGYSDAILIAAWDDSGAHCVVLADRETAQTLTSAPVRLGVAVAHGTSDELDGIELATERALALAGTDSAAAADDLPAGHPRIVQLCRRAAEGSPSLLAISGDDERTTIVVLA